MLPLVTAIEPKIHTDILSTPQKTQSTVESWISQHAKHYIAHAINSKNVEAVLKGGRVRPAEEVLSEEGSVFNEGNFLYVENTIKDHDKIKEQLGADADTYVKLWKQHLDQLVVKESGWGDIKFKSLPRPPYPDYIRKMYDEAYDKGIDLAALNLWLNKQDSLDVRLAKITKQCDLSGYEINEIRQLYFNCVRDLDLCNTVRAVENGIAWNYGKVVVLRGNPSDIIGSHLLSTTANEVGLLPPWQNGGQYCHLDLSHKDIIILGPKKILEPFSKQYKVGYIEDLTEEQKKFFKVPEKILTSLSLSEQLLAALAKESTTSHEGEKKKEMEADLVAA
jgi:hypothetical protein